MNAELLQPVYAEWEKGNFTPRFEVYADDLEWGWSDEFPDLARPALDPEERSERLRGWLRAWEHWQVVVDDYVEVGDKVVVLTRYQGRGRSSGFFVNTDGAHVWTFRDGRAVRLEIFSSRERALASARAPGATR